MFRGRCETVYTKFKWGAWNEDRRRRKVQPTRNRRIRLQNCDRYAQLTLPPQPCCTRVSVKVCIEIFGSLVVELYRSPLSWGCFSERGIGGSQPGPPGPPGSSGPPGIPGSPGTFTGDFSSLLRSKTLSLWTQHPGPPTHNHDGFNP